MEFKTPSIMVPMAAEVFNDLFTREDNYEMIRIGRQNILNRNNGTPPPIMNGTDNTTNTDKIRGLETQIEWMRTELLKYGILCESTGP